MAGRGCWGGLDGFTWLFPDIAHPPKMMGFLRRYEMLFFGPQVPRSEKSSHVWMASDGLFENAISQNRGRCFYMCLSWKHELNLDLTWFDWQEWGTSRGTILGRHLSELLQRWFPKNQANFAPSVWMQWKSTNDILEMRHQQPLTTVTAFPMAHPLAAEVHRSQTQPCFVLDL